MRTFIGIDLGSTTTKAVLLDDNQDVIGRGITNSRSNYGTAARVASEEARIDGRFTLFRRALSSGEANGERVQEFLGALERNFRLVQFLEQLSDLEETCIGQLRTERFAKVAAKMGEALREVFDRLKAEAPELYAPGAKRKSDFFRDIAGSRFHVHAEVVAREANAPHDILLNAYDKSIIEVENRPPAGDMSDKFRRAMARVLEIDPHLIDGSNNVPGTIEETLGIELEETYLVGTGYGRVTLPFSKEHIRSEIPPRARRAHHVSEDPHGARYRRAGHQRHPDRRRRHRRELPDERSLRGGLWTLSRLYRRRDGYGVARTCPLAMKSNRPARINSTCTVFAGAELRDRLSLGEKREDILAGLHRAIILRAINESPARAA